MMILDRQITAWFSELSSPTVPVIADRIMPCELAFQAHSQAARPLLERALAAFKDVTDRLTNMSALKATGKIGDGRQLAWLVWTHLRNNDLVGVRVNNQVGIVRDHDHLALVFGFEEQAHELIEDRLRV